jgi:predicted CopG family antitoxin
MTKHIEIDEEIHKKLTEIGKKGETYSDIIGRLISYIK